MFREIKKKKLILENRRPYKKGVADAIREMDFLDWIQTSLRIDGSSLSREQVREMFLNGPVTSATVFECSLIENLKHLISKAFDMQSMNLRVTDTVIAEAYNIISSGSEPVLRRDCSPVAGFGHIPPATAAIPEQLDIFTHFINTSQDEYSSNPLEKAAQIHNRFIEIYPFPKWNEELARFFMFYYLLCRGYPAFILGFSGSEYTAAVKAYLEKNDSSLFYGAIERAVFSKLDALMHLTAPE
ncbi:MAG: Fic family protein [Clostridia bacterium]|nr:Fic family protein [Clostridia bacterium]